MIPRKLAEIFFSRLWVLVLPLVLVPALVVVATKPVPQYESRASVWVRNTPSGAATTYGLGLNYLTPAQNQAQALNDLLATDTFRRQVAVSAGLTNQSAPIEAQEQAAWSMSVWATTVGANLVVVGARSPSAEAAQQVVTAVIALYLDRATQGAEYDAALKTEYYNQQLVVAEAELAQRQEALQRYLAQNPTAAVPGSAASMSLDYRALVNRVEAQRAIVDGLVGQVQETERELASAPQSQEAAFAVQDDARLPREPLPISPTRRFGLPFAGLLFGMGISCAYLIGRYRTDHSVRSIEELEGSAIPVLGSVVELRPSRFYWLRQPKALLRPSWRAGLARRTAASIPVSQET